MALSAPLKIDNKRRAVVLVDALMEYVQLLDSGAVQQGVFPVPVEAPNNTPPQMNGCSLMAKQVCQATFSAIWKKV